MTRISAICTVGAILISWGIVLTLIGRSCGVDSPDNIFNKWNQTADLGRLQAWAAAMLDRFPEGSKEITNAPPVPIKFPNDHFAGPWIQVLPVGESNTLNGRYVDLLWFDSWGHAYGISVGRSNFAFPRGTGGMLWTSGIYRRYVSH